MKRLFAPLADGRTWSASLHLLLDLPFGIAWFVITVVGLSLGVGLVPLALVGLVVLMATVALGRVISSVERARAKALLGVTVLPPQPRPAVESGSWRRMRSLLRDPEGWKGLAYGFIKFPLGIINFTIVVTMWSVAFGGTAFPLWGWAVPTNFGDNHPIHGWWRVAYIAGNFVVGILFFIVTPRVVRGLAAMDAGLIKGLLGGSPTDQLRQRVETLTVSRDASVDIAETERRRIERDLHDGVQAQLVTLAMDLGMARQKLESGDDADPAVLALVERAHDDSKRAVADLRNLVRGIHPAVLTDRGLDAALSSVAARSPVPVDLRVDAAIGPHGARPGPNVESIAYFVVSESLANVAKHSGATRAAVQVARRGNRLILEVTDNGRGGADPALGTGLAGLRDRVDGVDGWFHVSSPIGGPTTLTVELPCGS